MEDHLTIALFCINFLQIAWFIGYKQYYSLKITIFLSIYLVILFVVTELFTSINTFVFLLIYVLLELFPIYQRFKKWTLVALFYLLRDTLMIISWLFTWDILFLLRSTGNINTELFYTLKPFVLIGQQILLFLLIFLSHRINNKYYIFSSISQLHKKYVFPSMLCLASLIFFNIVKRISFLSLRIETFFYLNIIMLGMFAVFSYTFYIISQYYQQQQHIHILSKKSLDESHKVLLANEFKHDYRNILLSLSAYLNQNDLSQAQSYLDSIVQYSTPLTNENFNAQISPVNVLSVQGLLINFFESCHKKDIAVYFSANEHISELDITINLIDFIRCLSILLDNAAEASLNEEAAAIYIQFEKNNQQLIVDVRNTFNGTIALNKILKNNFTTKKDHQGKGLHIFTKILKQYENAAYSFEKDQEFFIARFSLPESD